MNQSLEERIAALEKKVAEFHQTEPQAERQSSKEALMQTFGRAKGDPYFESAMRLGAAWREEENRRSIEELDARA